MKRIILLFTLVLALGACENVETYEVVNNDFKRNYDAAWNLVNENYCFLGYKNIDWDKVYDKYLPQVEQAKDECEFFDIMCDFVDELRDGHAGIMSNFDRHASMYRLEADGTVSPNDYISRSAVAAYLVDDRVTKNGYTYGYVNGENGRKYVYFNYLDFSKNLGGVDLEYISRLIKGNDGVVCDGIIFDLRENPGGAVSYGIDFAGHFFSEEKIVIYTAKKNGVGYDDFTEPNPIKVTPKEENNWSNIPTTLLTNRSVYSTANIVTSVLKSATNVKQVGARSGGGGGMPVTHYLPNGWALIFPENVIYDLDLNHIENGIEPDIEVHISRQDEIDGKDRILEKAIEVLNTGF